MRRVPAAILLSTAVLTALPGCGRSTGQPTADLSSATATVETLPTLAVETTTSPTPTPTPSPVDRTRGLLSLPESMARAYLQVHPSECTEQGIGGDPHAYDLGSGARFCSNVSTFTDGVQPWGGRFAGAYIDFEPAVNEAKALKILRKLLPADAKETLRQEGRNEAWTSVPEASCLTVYYTSASLVPIRKAIGSGGDPEAASFTLYTDFWEISEGAGAPYDPEAITFASIGTSSWLEGPGC